MPCPVFLQCLLLCQAPGDIALYDGLPGLHDAVWVPALCCMQGKRVWGLPPHSLALPDPRQASQLTKYSLFCVVQAVQEAVQEAVQDAVQEVRL